MRRLLVWATLVLATVALASACRSAVAQEGDTAVRAWVRVTPAVPLESVMINPPDLPSVDTVVVDIAWAAPPAGTIDSVEVVAYGPWEAPMRRVSKVVSASEWTIKWPVPPDVRSLAGAVGACVLFYKNGQSSGGLWPADLTVGVPPNCSAPVPFSYAATPAPVATGVSAAVRVIRP